MPAIFVSFNNATYTKQYLCPIFLIMYMAYTKKNGRPHYVLRESCILNHELGFKDIFNIGPDPSVFIKYIGCNAFYFDEDMEDAVSNCAPNYNSDALEDIFWPWVRPDVKRAVDTFRNRSNNHSRKLTDLEKEKITTQVHGFDKRRAHFLKFGNMDQGPIENMPPVLFKSLVQKSRDEIEQNFMHQEYALKSRDLKTYVYTIFNLQRFFKSFMAKRMPHALDQEKVDAFFIETLCEINTALFNNGQALDEYMIRYAIMFFDHQYADSTLLDDFSNAFMNRHRSFKAPPPKETISQKKALKIFNITQAKFKTLTKKNLTKQYRGLAQKFHPDTGGSHEKFVELNSAHETLIEKIRF